MNPASVMPYWINEHQTLMQRSLQVESRKHQEEVRLLLAKRSRRKRRVKVQPPGSFLYEQVPLSY